MMDEWEWIRSGLKCLNVCHEYVNKGIFITVTNSRQRSSLAIYMKLFSSLSFGEGPEISWEVFIFPALINRPGPGCHG